MNDNDSKNLIFYGASGCGKTYNAISETLRILGVDTTGKENNLLEIFNDVRQKSGQVEYISFHETYSYTDFVEGMKPNIRNAIQNKLRALSHSCTDGILKKIAQNALFSCLDIPEEKKEEYFSFRKVLSFFQQIYPMGSVIEIQKSRFEIVRYTYKTIAIRPSGQSSIIDIQVEPLRRLLLINSNGLVKGQEYAEILADYREFAGYYCAIFMELCNVVSAIKYSFIEEFYRGSYTLKKDNLLPHVLIIEEIDSCKLSEVFGELISLIDEDKRSKLTVSLPYSQEKFMLPENLYIIGTVTTPISGDLKTNNTLIRRFEIVHLKPDSSLVADFGCNFSQKFEIMNDRIALLAGHEYLIGHGLFIKDKYADADIDVLKKLFFRHIIPRFVLYFRNDWEKLQALFGTAKDDNTSFIKIKKGVHLLNGYECKSADCFEFVSIDDKNFDFKTALENVFS